MSPGSRGISKWRVENRDTEMKGRERIWQEISPPNIGTKHSHLSEVYLIFVINLKK